VTEREIKASAKAAAKKEEAAPAAAAPAAEPAPAPAAEPAPAPAPEHKKLPKTASPMPLVALIGFLSLGAGLGLTAIRRTRATR
jgi:LPXTG-motif cell wall-anchored protein